MNKLSTTIIGIIALVALSLGIVAVSKPALVREVVDRVGAVASPDFNSHWMRLGGSETWSWRAKFGSATTTPCAIQSPAATSTLVRASATFSVSSTTASVVTIAKATTAYATSTRLAFGTIAANAQGTIVAIATTTDATGGTSATDPFYVFGPNNFVVVGMAGGIGTFSPTGYCSATFSVN